MRATKARDVSGARKGLSAAQRQELFRTLKARFEEHRNRPRELAWAKVQARLEARADKLWSLHEMKRTGGEPDVVGQDERSGEIIFYDCSEESPKGSQKSLLRP